MQTRRRATTPSTWAPPCCRSWRGPTGSRRSAFCSCCGCCGRCSVGDGLGRRRRAGDRSPGVMLAVATAGFAVNFWAWALISPLGPMFKDAGALGELAVGRGPARRRPGAGRLPRTHRGRWPCTDSYGGRLMFTLVSAVTIVPVLFIAFVALDSYALLLVGGFFLGVGGHRLRSGRAVRERMVPAQASRVGDRDLRRWYGRNRDQRAHHGEALLHQRRASKLPVPDHRPRRSRSYAVVAWVVLRDAPGRVRYPTASLTSRARGERRDCASLGRRASCTPWRSAATWRSRCTCPPISKTAHGLTAADAANRMAGFVVDRCA